MAEMSALKSFCNIPALKIRIVTVISFSFARVKNIYYFFANQMFLIKSNVSTVNVNEKYNVSD